MMELRQFEHFVAVAEERSFTQAAARCNIVQSGLSASIRTLEEEIGARLFIRSSRSLSITREAKALLGEAYRALSAVGAGIEAIAEAGRRVVGEHAAACRFLALVDEEARKVERESRPADRSTTSA